MGLNNGVRELYWLKESTITSESVTRAPQGVRAAGIYTQGGSGDRGDLPKLHLPVTSNGRHVE